MSPLDLSLDALPVLVTLSPTDGEDRPRVERLAARLRAADAVLVERVMRELWPGVRRLAFRLLGPRPELDDAVQDAMSEIASSLHRFEGRSSLTTLAHSITVRTVYRYYRKRGAIDARLVALEDAAGQPQERLAESPEERALTRELVARVHGCLARLGEQRRTAWVLCVVEGLTPTEAAELEGCSALAMRSRLFHARADMTREMRRDELLAARMDSRSEDGKGEAV